MRPRWGHYALKGLYILAHGACPCGYGRWLFLNALKGLYIIAHGACPCGNGHCLYYYAPVGGTYQIVAIGYEPLSGAMGVMWSSVNRVKTLS